MEADTEQKLEIYRQRYETWRHLDTRRLQLTQFAVAAISAVFLASASFSNLQLGFVMVVFGVIFLLSFGTLRQINLGIVENGKALREYGTKIGDRHIPDVSNRHRSIFYLIEVLFLVLGATCLIGAIYIY